MLDDENKLIYSTYERHYSRITEKIAEILALVRTRIDGVENASVALSGSAGMGVAESVGVDFIQEVYATRVAANTFIPGTDVIIELGGEDAKILFLTNGLEVRMNGTCAGGTGAFIDQMERNVICFIMPVRYRMMLRVQWTHVLPVYKK